MPFAPSHSHSPANTDRQLVFTSSQAARYLGISLATIRRWADAGHLSCYRTPGGQRRFSREQLDGFDERLSGDDRERRNQSSIHIDFMIGGNDVTVTGLGKDGNRTPLLVDGAWQI